MDGGEWYLLLGVVVWGVVEEGVVLVGELGWGCCGWGKEVCDVGVDIGDWWFRGGGVVLGCV